jgi:general stress protein 26
MYNHTDLRFLQEKIRDLRSALLFSEQTALLKLSTTIIHVLQLDDLGQLWFFVTRPMQALHEFDKEFPVRMEFFRKGREFFLHIKGKAFIVDDPEEINKLVFANMLDGVPDHMILVKVKMSKADYFESQVMHHAGWWNDLRSRLHAWLFNVRRGYKPYEFDRAEPTMALSSL